MKPYGNFRNNSIVLLSMYVSVFLIAYIAGSALAGNVSADVMLTMRSLPSTGTPHLFAHAVLLFPLLATFLILRYLTAYCLLPLIFIKVSSFSFCVCSLLYSFPAGGWLVCCLLLFSSAASLVVYIWLWTRCFLFKSLQLKRDLIISLLIIAFFASAQIHILSPFAAQLFIHK